MLGVRVLLVIVLSSLLGLVGVIGSASPAAAATTYSDYAVFGNDGVFIGGGSDVQGLVGARNDTGGGAQGQALRMAAQTTIVGDARVGARVFLNAAADISGTLYHVGAKTGNGTVGSDQHVADADLPPVWPPPMQWPAPGPAAHCAVDHTPDITKLGNNAQVTLTPGTYGTINNGSTDLTLDGSGDYFIDTLSMAHGSTITITAPPVRLFVCGKMKMGRTHVFPESLNPGDFTVEIAGTGLGANEFAFTMPGGRWIGNVLIPTRPLHFGSGGGGGTFLGHMFAQRIDIEHGTFTTKRAKKSGVKWHDVNGNGVRDLPDDVGLAGWTIYVDYNDNGVIDPGEPSAVTGAGGTYQIVDILPGTWKVREVQQPGWECTFPFLKDAKGCYYEELFMDGLNLEGNDFGNWQPSGGKSGVKFHDLNANGVLDQGEPGLPGWTIWVDYNDNGVIDPGEPSAVTGVGGAYNITGINPGTWRVHEVGQPGWFCSFPLTSDAHGCYHEELFQTGVTNANNLFGNYQKSKKSGFKFNDLNMNGVWNQPDEPGLAGWTIYVDYNDNGILDPGEPSAVTQADGSYVINGVQPGTWKVHEVQQPGWVCSFPLTTDAHGCYHEETFVSGQEQANNLFGNFLPSGGGDCKWCTKGAVISQVWQNMGVCCAIPDILVDIRMSQDDPVEPSEIGTNQPATGSIQKAIDYVNANGDPSPGDGEIFIGVTAMDCGTGVVPTGDCAGQSGRGPGGSGTQNVDIRNMNPERLNVFGCSITLNAADTSKPVVSVHDGVGKVTVLDIHVKGSSTAGYYAENNADPVVLKNSRAQNNDIGYRINDTNVEVTGSPSIDHNRIGIQVDGDGNTLRDNNHINDNTTDGVLLTATADNNSVRNNDSDENLGNGIHVLGKNNTLLDNNTDKNGKNGVLADSAEGASGNSLHGMVAESNTLQGIKACGQIDAGQNKGSNNGVNPQVDFVCAPPPQPIVQPPPPIVQPPPPSGTAALFVPDDQDNMVYGYTATGAATGSFATTSANANLSDIAVVGSTVYVLDSSDKQIYRYSSTGTFEAVSKVMKQADGSSLSSPAALGIDGDEVWVSDGSKKQIYRYSLAALFAGSGNASAMQQFAVPSGNNAPHDLVLDATYVYSLDMSTKQLYRVRRDGTGSATVSKVMKETGGGNLGNPSGMMLAGDDLYVADYGKDKIYRYSLSALFSGTGNLNATSQFATTSDNADARGL